jgi:Fe-S cluster biogenesis protein NfuA
MRRIEMDVGEYQSQATRIEALLQEVAAFPESQVRTKIEELIHSLLNMYGEGLKRILEFIARIETDGQSLTGKVASDELVGALLLLHGLHPISLETRLLQALENIQPRVQAQGGVLEFVRLEDGVATVRLTGGGCHGCQSSQATLRQMVEEAVYTVVPDLDEIQVEGAAAPHQAGIPVKFLPPRRRKESASASAPASVSPGQAPGRSGVR